MQRGGLDVATSKVVRDVEVVVASEVASAAASAAASDAAALSLALSLFLLCTSRVDSWAACFFWDVYLNRFDEAPLLRPLERVALVDMGGRVGASEEATAIGAAAIVVQRLLGGEHCESNKGI